MNGNKKEPEILLAPCHSLTLASAWVRWAAKQGEARMLSERQSRTDRPEAPADMSQS